jgi:hypothetical protein
MQNEHAVVVAETIIFGRITVALEVWTSVGCGQIIG